MGAAGNSQEKEVEQLLAQLRDSPVDNNGANPFLGVIFGYLFGLDVNKGKSVHWFCSKASSPVVIEAATFLLRLFAYDGENARKWKQVIGSCLLNCSSCNLGLERIKTESKTTYFGAFVPTVLENFWIKFAEWELSVVLTELSAIGLDENTTETTATIPSTLPNYPEHHPEEPPTTVFKEWPTDPVPPGVLLSLIHEDSVLRNWSLSQASQAKTIPIPCDVLVPSYRRVTEVIVNRTDSNLPVSLVGDQVTFWNYLNEFLRFMPPEYLVSNDPHDIRHFIIGHLHDNDADFEYILRSFILVLKRAGTGMWLGEAPEYPQVAFDALKDNPSYLDLLRNEASANPGRSPWPLSWLTDFLDSLHDRPGYQDAFAKIAEFVCGELQHERFSDARPAFIIHAAKLFHKQSKKQPAITSNLLDIHANTFTAVLFSRSHFTEQWSTARMAARELIQSCLGRDAENIKTEIDTLCGWLAYRCLNGKMPSVEGHSRHGIRRQLWSKMYQTFHPQDIDGLRSIIAVVSKAAHQDVLLEKGFDKILSLPIVRTTISQINEEILHIRSGFTDVITAFVDHNLSTTALELLNREGVIQDVVKLILSPVDDIRDSAQALVGHAFDVDSVRTGCYRSLLANFPTSSIDGMSEFLSNFASSAATLPQAVGSSKWMVRTFTDVLDVLCSSPRGLLLKPQYLKGSDNSVPQLVNLWSAMCKAILVIYKRTSDWSLWFPSEEMTEWMRDALIFVRELIAHRSVIETAVNTGKPAPKSGTMSAMGKKMVQDLHEFFLALRGWLRVTDMELLHQTYHLTMSLLEYFREAGMPPPEKTLEKLNKMIKEARKGDPNRGSRLDNARLSRLEEAIGWFEEDGEDDIVFVSMGKTEKKTQPTVKEEVPSSSKLTKPIVSKPPVPAKPVKALPKPTPSLPPAKLSTKSSKGFSAADEERLLAAHRVPTFKKSTTSTVVKSRAPSKSVPSSGSESSDDEEEEESQGAVLAQLAKMQKSPKIKKQAERRQIMQIDIPNMQNNPVAERIRKREEARRTTLRLQPDVSGLHRELLSWKYDHMGPHPPNWKRSLTHISNVFSDFSQYRRVFEPLLLLECWSQLLQSKEDKPEFLQCKLGARQNSGQFIDVDLTIAGGAKKDWYLTENDVVLLRSMDGKKSLLAKILNYRNTQNETQIGARCLIENGDDPLLLNTSWQIGKVLSLSTLHREYGALIAAEYYDCAQQILHPKPNAIPPIDSQTVKRTMERYGVNEPQAVAIAASLKTPGFNLIQGPPGTGKTSTICGLVAACLSTGAGPTTIVPGKQRVEPNSPKILICAPSNAAIDEIVGRLKDGIRGLQRKSKPFKVVRIGADQAISVNVKDVSLDYLVDEKLNSVGAAKSDFSTELAAVRQELASVKNLKQQKTEELNQVHDNGARVRLLDDEIKGLNARRGVLTRKLDSLRDNQRAQGRAMDAERRKARQEVLVEADVICSTLSGAGHDTLDPYDFEMIIIDEAAQAIELSSLIPLKFRCDRFIMVGDPQQLPPTVISQEACKYQYNQSLFVRLQKQRPDAVHLLSIQYRMHPDISTLPSAIFYHGKLKDGPGMREKTARPWHSNGKFGTYRFFNVKGQEEKSGQSMKNRLESQVVIALYKSLRREFSKVDFTMKIGIVSMYRAQVVELRNAFYREFGKDKIAGEVDFNTVDGFQGQEKDIIILSCVRAGPGVTSVGFLADVRRMNVAITRAKASLYIVGNAPTLERSNETWRHIVQDARSRETLTDVDEAYFNKSIPANNIKSTVVSPNPSPVTHKTSTPDLPSDLVTPQHLKQRNEEKRLPEPKSPPTNSGKRKRVDSTFAEDSLNTPPAEPQPKPAPARPPIPPKRPKPQPNIFLPKQKNKNKRPPPPDNESGPSTNKRRF